MSIRKPFWRLGALHAAVVVLFSAGAGATTTCPGTLNNLAGGTFDLADDYTWTGVGSCFYFSGGGTVDLHGHSITRTGGTGIGISAIGCQSAGVTIKDSSATKGTISGVMSYGILNCENIDGVKIDGSMIYGVYNSTYALDSLTNSYVSADTFAVSVKLKNRSSNISYNNVHATNIGLEITSMLDTSGAGRARIDHNVVRNGKYYQISSGTGLIDLRTNYLIEQDPADAYPDPAYCISLASGALVDRLYCDDDDCADASCTPVSDVSFDFPEYGSPGACPGTNITSNYTLTSSLDLAATSGTCLNVTGAVTIDLNGHTISNSSTGGAAITCAATNVLIKDSSDTFAKGGIRGNFAQGIVNCSNVDSVRIGDGVDTGVFNSNGLALTSLKNSTIDADTTAVSAWMATRNTASIENNWLRGGSYGVSVDGVLNIGTGKALIGDNSVSGSTTDALYATGSSSSWAEFKNNLLYDDPTATSTGCYAISSAAFSHLMCACASQCEMVDPPMSYPLL